VWACEGRYPDVILLEVVLLQLVECLAQGQRIAAGRHHHVYLNYYQRIVYSMVKPYIDILGPFYIASFYTTSLPFPYTLY
jgi:hypothetical protein